MTAAPALRLLSRVAIRAALAVTAFGWTIQPAVAQVLEIGDDGTVAVHAGPTITDGEGSQPIATHAAILPVAVVQRAAAMRTVRPAAPLGTVFASAAHHAGLDPRLLHAVAWQESRFRHASVSPKGAIGIMQLMPGTARDLGVDPRDLTQNVQGGAVLLARLLRRYRGDLDLALAAYNAGPGAVSRHGGVPPYAETRDYIARIRHSLGPWPVPALSPPGDVP